MEQHIARRLADHWKTCGVESGDLLLLHSSLKRLLRKLNQEAPGLAGPQEIFDSLLLALGEDGTLVLPLYNFDFPKTGYFSMRDTPSHMGALTEIGRNYPGAVRTGHPIYSFAVIGKQANEFLGIDNKSGYGADSPFARIKELNGKIGVIGLSDQESMTSYHFVEEQNQVDYRYFKEFEGKYLDLEGRESQRVYSLYVRDLEKGVKTDVNRMMDYLWETGAYKGEKFDEGYGMRTIMFRTLYAETEAIIRRGDAIRYLYSIEK
jgi:aminoglycoside 3-N-acetyltransferase